MATKTLPPRSEIPKEHTWNSESVFPDREAWRAECEAIAGSLADAQKFAGKLSDSPAVLADWMETASELFKRLDTVRFYAGFLAAVDANDQEATAMYSQVQELTGSVLAAGAFSRPEMLEIGEETIRQWLKDEPRLAAYEHYFSDLFRQQPHVRSAEVEEVLGMLAGTFASIQNTTSMLTSADMYFPDAASSDGESLPVAQSTIHQRLQSPDREERRSAWENYRDEYLRFKNTLASNYITSVKRDVFNARARRHETALEATLYRNDISVEVFHNLIDTFKKNLPTWHRYWEVRGKGLGIDKLQPYDIWAPISTEQPHVPYEQAVDWVSEGVKPLGEEYVEVLRRGCLQDRWVDIYPNQGKRQGAFSWGAPGTFPCIMMSYDDGLSGMSTLAHELGHSMHSYLTWENQPLVYSGYSMFVAEVASNFHQAMTRAYLFETMDDPNFQLALIEEAMGNFHRYFFIMPTLARFELEVHTRTEAGQGVTADDMISLMADLFAEGYGDTMGFNHERTGITWATFGHLFISYYPFQYATGISAAHALADKVRSGGAEAAKDYRSFLSAGSSLYPIDALKLAGVDMATPEAVEKTFAVLADMVDRLDELTG